MRWADEDELPERLKKPTTPRDNRAFTDRPSKMVQQPSTVLSTPSAPAPQPYQASSADNCVIYGVSSHLSTSEADISRRATRDRAVHTLTRAHHHRLSRPWGTLPVSACVYAGKHSGDSRDRQCLSMCVCVCVCSFWGSVQRSDLRRYALLRHEIGSGERQASEFTSQHLRTARLDLSMLSSRAAPSRSEDLQGLGSSLSHLQLRTAGSSSGQPQASSEAGSLSAPPGGWRIQSSVSISDPLGVQADSARAAALAVSLSPRGGARGVGEMPDKRNEQSGGSGPRVVMHF